MTHCLYAETLLQRLSERIPISHIAGQYIVDVDVLGLKGVKSTATMLENLWLYRATVT